MKKSPAIYALSDPLTGRIRYIGRTCTSLKVRLNGHIQCAVRGKKVEKSKENWILELRAQGLRPSISLIQESTFETVCADEVRLLAEYRESYPDLLNIRKGGGGGTITGSRGIKWTPEFEALLGKLSDPAVAKRVGIGLKTVLTKRKELGIAAADMKHTYPRPKTPGSCRRVHLSESVVKQLGTMPDTYLAKLAGIEPSLIYKRRVELGIAKYEGPTNRVYARTYELSDPKLAIIGTLTDKKAGAILGVSHTCVRHARLALNIPPYGKRKLSATGSPSTPN